MKKKFGPVIRSAEQALRESQSLARIWSDESRLTQRILIYVAGLLEQQSRPKKWRAISRWQRFSADAVRHDKTLKQAAVEWKAKTRQG